MSLRERTRPGLGIIEPCPPSSGKAVPPSGPSWIHIAMRLRVLVVAAGLLWPVSVLSQESRGFFTGNDLYDKCTAESVVCAAYVAGMADALSHDGTVCLPQNNVTTRQLVDVVVAYLRAHPEMRNYSAASIGDVAFTQAFPCASKRRPPR
jgi:hypothetical protein